jgi:hypothetical protein
MPYRVEALALFTKIKHITFLSQGTYEDALPETWQGEPLDSLRRFVGDICSHPCEPTLANLVLWDGNHEPVPELGEEANSIWRVRGFLASELRLADQFSVSLSQETFHSIPAITSLLSDICIRITYLGSNMPQPANQPCLPTVSLAVCRHAEVEHLDLGDYSVTRFNEINKFLAGMPKLVTVNLCEKARADDYKPIAHTSDPATVSPIREPMSAGVSIRRVIWGGSALCGWLNTREGFPHLESITWDCWLDDIDVSDLVTTLNACKMPRLKRIVLDWERNLKLDDAWEYHEAHWQPIVSTLRQELRRLDIEVGASASDDPVRFRSASRSYLHARSLTFLQSTVGDRASFRDLFRHVLVGSGDLNSMPVRV